MPKEPVHRFQLSMETGSGARKTVEVSHFAIPAYHPALSTVVHVLRDGRRKASALERRLAEEADGREPLWPIETKAGQPIDLTAREKEILRCLAQGLPTAAIGKKLFIAGDRPQPRAEHPPKARRAHQARGGRVRVPARPDLTVRHRPRRLRSPAIRGENSSATKTRLKNRPRVTS